MQIRSNKTYAKIGLALMDVSMFVVGFSLAGHEETIAIIAVVTGAIGRILHRVYGTEN